MAVLKGIPAAPGIAMGKVITVDSEELLVPRRTIADDDVAREIQRLDEALAHTRSQLQLIQKRLEHDLGQEHAEIFNAHLLVLEDQSLREEILQGLRRDKLNVEAVVNDVIRRHLKAFSRTNDEYLRERTADIEDVRKRILRNLLGKSSRMLQALTQPAVIVARDLSPSETAQMHRRHVLAFITEIGGRTSHTAIMAKSLEIPAVVGLTQAMEIIPRGKTVIVDGTRGEVIVDPDAETIERYKVEERRYQELNRQLMQLKNLPAETLDHHHVHLWANIELPEEVKSVVAHGASGIGLFRTEFLYLNRDGFPTEEEQYRAYRSVMEQMGQGPVVIRTMDLGGDKFLSPMQLPEMNPFMGWRGIRFSLTRPDIFRTQLRAALRASIHGDLRIMYPLISGVEEIQRAKEILEEVRQELRQEGIPFKDVKVGAMIEVPSAALTCDILAQEVDFFSIGTNDLIQYSLAVDRVNEKIAHLYEPTHPAVLRLVKNIVECAHTAKIPVAMCGEMAGEPSMTLLLLGMGIDELSTSPVQLPLVKRVVRAVEYSFARQVAQQAMKLRNSKEVETFLLASLRQVVPDLAE